MTEQDVANKVLAEIKDIRPKPRWHFLVKDYIIWLLGLVSLVLGSLAMAAALHILINNDWDIYRQISSSFLKFVIVTLPYFWFIFLTLFVLAAYYNFKNTKKGYKFPFYKLVLLNIFFSLVFGAWFYSLGLGQRVEYSFAEDFPLYQDLFNTRKRIWMQTDRGLMAAMIISIDGDKLTVRDFAGNDWQIAKSNNFHCPPLAMSNGDNIRILGRKIDSYLFEADCILPLRGVHLIGPPPPERKMVPMRIIK